MGPDRRPSDDVPSEDVRAWLERVLASRQFSRAQRASAFLRYVVEARLTGEGDGTKETLIAMHVYGRGSDYDPAIDSLVRVEAGRLREKLERYYREDGREDAVVFELPRGSYQPEWRTQARSGAGGHVAALPGPSSALVSPAATDGGASAVSQARARTTGPSDTDEPANPDAQATAATPNRAWRRRLVWALLAVLAATALAGWAWSEYRRHRVELLLVEARSSVRRAGDYYLQPAQVHHPRPLDELLAAVSLYEQALALAPDSTQGLAGLAEAYWLAGEYDRSLYEKSRHAARELLARAPDSSDGHFYLGHIAFFQDRDFDTAYTHLLAALTASPKSESLYRYFGNIAGVLRRENEARLWLERGRRELPDSTVVALTYAAMLGRQGRLDEMLAETTVLVRRRPDVHTVRRLHAQALAAHGRREEAEQELARCLALSLNDPGCTTDLAVLHARGGRRREALAGIEQLRAQPDHAVTVAMVYAALGERAEVLRWLEAGFDRSDYSLPFILWDRSFEAYLDDPGFQALVARLGLPLR
jgi:tetratricopeptide (TPR) repeat protein